MSTPLGPLGGSFGCAERAPRDQHPGRADVYQELERILAHPLFQTAQRLSAFLRFAVDNVIAGRAEQLKEYVIGVEVFDRGASYSPQEDPVVRIMAGRLRSRLAEYYQGSGNSDPVLIELPRGGYAARVSWRQQPVLPVPAAPKDPPRAPPLPRSDSVGRDEELSRLRAAFASAAAGAGAMLTICGEPGLGKTTIAEDFLAEIQNERQTERVGNGHCSERLADTDAFAPIFESLERLLRREPGSRVAQVMQATAPAWYLQVMPARGGPAEMSAAGTSSHERMRREFVSFLEELSRSEPVVLFLDDMHWADASTCDLLAYLGTHIRNIRILILMTYRPAEVLARQHPFLPLKVDLERRGVCEDLPLSFLSLGDVEHYISSQFPRNSFPPTFARVVHERTEGNPLFMKEMLRFLRDRRILSERGGAWILEQPVSEVRTLIPTSVGSMIRLKIDQLTNESRDILLCAAVEGLQFDSAVVAQVLSLDAAEVEECLQELDAAHNFVSKVAEQEFANRVFSVRYRFVHVFYQNALSAFLAPSRRAAYSAAIARTLVDFTGEASREIAADLALLFESGRDSSNASQYFFHAARSAAHVFAYPEAVILCERGLRALSLLPESPARDAQELRFSLILGMSLMATRGYAAPEVEKTYRRSRELCHQLKETRRLLSVLWGLHTSTHIAGELPSALEVARELRQVAEQSGDPIAVVESLHALGTTLAFMGRLAEAREALERIFASYPLSQHVFHGSLYVLDPCVTSLSMLARLLAFMGHPDLAMEKAAASVELANRLAHPQSLAYAILWVGCIHHARGEYAESCPHLESAMALSREHKLPQILEWGRIMRGSALTHLGRASEGIFEIRKSLDRQYAMRSLIERSYCLTLLAEALAGEGAYLEALALCGEAVEFALRTEGRCYESETHRVRAEILLALGDQAQLPQVETELEYALQVAREAQCRLLELQAAKSYFRLHHRLGDAARGRAALVGVLSSFAHEAGSPTVLEARQLIA